MKWWLDDVGSLELVEVDDDRKGLENVLIVPFQGEPEELGEPWKGTTFFCTAGNVEKC